VTNKVYTVIRHRNHLPIMSAINVEKNSSTGNYEYNFTTSGSNTYGYDQSSGIKSVEGTWCMVGGEGVHDGEINTSDIIFTWDPYYGEVGYYAGDFNMDGSIDTSDYVIVWDPNYGFIAGIGDAMRRGFRSTVPE
jgi:hypothetical protein